MKKIIAICSLILCVALLVTVFTSCDGKKDDVSNQESESYVASVNNGEFSFTAEVGENETVIKNNGKVYQTLKYPVNPGYPFDYSYAKERSQFIDMNFDGQADFYIAVSAEAETIYYFCWLFNATTKQFDYSVSLSGLTNISVDAENQVIYSTFKYRDTTKIVSYRWVDGQLKNDEIYDTSSDTIPAEVTEGAKENAIGTVTRPALTTTKPKPTEENKKPTKNNNNTSTGTTANSGNTTSSSTTAEDKPLNTTTTEPQTNGIQIETGNIDDGWF